MFVLLTGIGGLTSFGQAAFVGLGAYTTAYLTTSFGMSPWLSLPVSLLVTGTAALLLGTVTLGLSGHYLPVCTIAWGLSLYFLAGNLSVLGGHDGITAIPPVTIGQIKLQRPSEVYWLIWISLLFAFWSVHNLMTSHSGRCIRCLRRHSVMIESFGISSRRIKTIIFVYAALLAALSGWLFAHYLLFVNPTPFGLNYSIEYLFMAVIGGATALWGAVVGAATLTLLRDVLQDVLPSILGARGASELLVFGLLMVLVLQRARKGIVPSIATYFPTRLQHQPRDTEAGLERVKRSQASGPLLKLDRVCRRFGVSFGIGAGEIVGLIGPNGAGKTTLFNLVTGALPVTDGRIEIKGTRADTLSARQIARLGLSRTFQHVQLQADMSAIDNVAVGAHLRCRTGFLHAIFRLDRDEERKLQADAWRSLKRLGLEQHANHMAGDLPLGQQRILEIARCLVADPELLLLDEPAAGLRHQEKVALAKILHELREEGLTILIVEHDMEFVMNLVDRLVVVNFGQKIAEGAPADIIGNPAVQDAYLGAA
jgi:branched-chain amino acid transport system permease protein